MKIQVEINTKENAGYYHTTIGSIQEIEFEDYIIGCTAGEIGNADIEACKAQAVACRTYGYRAIISNKPISDSSASAQAFRAPRITNPAYYNVIKAVQETQGVLIFFNNKIISPAAFTASNGGETVSSQARWGGIRPYLIQQADPWDIALGKTNKSGHGVGMSQRGTKYAASIGKGYQEILTFYYPGTVLVGNYGLELQEETNNMTEKEKVICDYAIEQLGHPYIYGATGKKCTPTYRKARMAQYPEYYEAMKRNCQVLKGAKSACNKCKWYDTAKDEALSSFDCAQLVRIALQQIGISITSGASSQWRGDYWEEKGTIDTLPVDKVCCLYRATSPKVMGHTGLYLGPLKITVDAHGHDYGVIKNTVQKYGKWTHWGIPKKLYQKDDKIVVGEEIIKMLYQVTVISKGTLRLRKAPSNTAPIITTIPEGTVVGVIEATSNEWTKVLYKGYEGYLSNTFIKKNENSVDTPTFFLKISAKDQADAEMILDVIKRIAESASVAS